MKALIIVDVQHDFLPGGSLAVEQGDQVIDYINSIQANYNVVVATQDWHPANHQSFASQHVGKKPFDEIILHGIPQVLWPDHCIQGSFGAEISPQLNMNHVQAIFRKGMDVQVDGYSGFFDNGRIHHTGMNGFLQELDVREVHVCGLAADYCVYYTAMDALDLGYKTAIISKGTKPIDLDNYRNKKYQFIQRGGSFI